MARQGSACGLFEFLAFVGGEILAVSNALIIGANLYRLSVVRGRFGTPIQTHALGSEIFLIAKDDLQKIQHPIFQPFNIPVL